MERLEPELNIDLLRHGQAKYEQGEVGIAEAGDLTEKGIAEVRASAAELAKLIRPDEEVAIWSSPTGRTLQTEKIVAEELKARGIQLREVKGQPIKVYKELGEVKNFSWGLFQPLVNGGEVTFGAEKFTIDKSQTNPRALSGGEYFNGGEIQNIPPEVKQTLPADYVAAIESFEEFPAVTARIMKPLKRLNKLQDKKYRVIIVTHEALTGFIANLYQADSQGINPAEFINLERKADKLIATRIGPNEIESDQDIFKAQ